jgi:arylsulfatase
VSSQRRNGQDGSRPEELARLQQASSAYDGFEGRIGRTFSTSEPSWPKRPTAPDGAPNVVVMLADDLGFSDLGCYGSEIATPNLDAIAAGGLRYSNFHVAPLCSPTRSALLTGRNAHAVGMGLVANMDPGFPGYAGELPANQPSLAEVMRANGYSTFAVGKWHLCKDSDMHEAGNRHSWPLQRGFDEYYGFLEALTNFHHPHRMYEGNTVVEVDRYPDGYYLTDDLTDRAIRMIRGAKAANPSKPFFLYFAHGAVHSPLQAKAEDIARQRGRYDLGWDRLREERLARQTELGVVPADTVLPPRNSEPGEDVVAWDSLSSTEQRLFAAYMEVYAAMVETIDESAGRLRQTLEELGEWENTVFVFLSDNGASREGRNSGVTNYWRSSATGPGDNEITPADLEHLENGTIGGPTNWPHYPRGWAMACNTPFRLYKLTAFRGGNQVPMLLSWPRRLDVAGQIRPQYQYVTDILPTLVDLIGLDLPTERHGLAAKPLDGSTFAATFNDPDAETTHGEQYLEVSGHRGYYRDGWEAVTFHEPLKPLSQERWQLYDIHRDPNQRFDVANQHPERVAELARAWEDAAWANGVFPLDDGTLIQYLWRPPSNEALKQPVTLPRATPTLERFRSNMLISGRSFRIAVDLEHRNADEGVLVAHGGQESGYVLYVENGTLHLVQNAHGVMRTLPVTSLDGAVQEIVVDVHAPGEARWDVTVSVDGTPASEGELVQLGWFAPYEGIDIGIDRRSPVSWDLYERSGPFPYTGLLRSVRYVPGELAPDAGQLAIEKAIEMGLALD